MADTPPAAGDSSDGVEGFTLEQLVAIYGAKVARQITASAAAARRPAAERQKEPVRSERAPHKILRREADGTAQVNVSSMEELQRESARTALDNDKQNNRLRLLLTRWAIAASSTMLLLGSAAFGVYVWSQWGHVEAWAINVYLASTVTEVLGILYVVATYLFPKRVHPAVTKE